VEGKCTQKCPVSQLLVKLNRTCENCPENCRSCEFKQSNNTLLNNTHPEYKLENIKCTTCNQPNMVLDKDELCKDRCPPGTIPVKQNQSGAMRCLEVKCSDYCQDNKCRDSSYCEACKPEINESGKIIGILRTSQGKCLPCDNQNGLKLVRDLNTQEILGCEEICADDYLYFSTWKEQEEKINLNKSLSLTVLGSQKLLTKHSCDDGNTQGGDGCSEKCEIEDGFVCKQSIVSGNSQRSVCKKKTKAIMSEIKGGINPHTYILKFD
jgi:cysteine-rich repeat protein